MTLILTIREDCVPLVLTGPAPTKKDDWGNPRFKVSLYWEGSKFGTFIRFISAGECREYMITAALHAASLFHSHRPEDIDEVADVIYRQYLPTPEKVYSA
jgi:hypothetical protein